MITPSFFTANRFARCFLLCLSLFATASLWAAKPKVVVSTSQIADIVRAVAADDVELTVLMGPGVDPHLFKATARDVVSLQRAQLILYNGLHLEGRLAETFSKVQKLGRTVVPVAEAVPAGRLIASADYEDAHDPHVWFDPELWVYAIRVTAESLAALEPTKASQFRERAKRYEEKTLDLQRWVQARIDSIPEARRVLITSHDAYNYFGRAFGLQVVGVQGVSTASEAGLADIARTADFIKERGIPAIFVESSVSPATIQRISKESGAVVGGELFSDALGALGELHSGSDGESYDVGTYFGMFKYNVDTIVQALAR